MVLTCLAQMTFGAEWTLAAGSPRSPMLYLHNAAPAPLTSHLIARARKLVAWNTGLLLLLLLFVSACRFQCVSEFFLTLD